ncbi:MAG: CDP-glycerol glycerophosphotransferase family protein [Natronospirillum sp.]
MIFKILKKAKTVLTYFLVYYPIYFFSFLTPRKKNRWIFGSAHGFSDNSKYLFIEVNESHKEIRAIWISRDRESPVTIRALGFEAYYLWSLKGFYYLLTSRVYISSHTFSNSLFLWTLGTAKFIQLWHGVPLKNMQFKIAAGRDYAQFNHWLLKWVYYPFKLTRYKKPDLFLKTSKISGLNYIESFNLKETILFEAEYPRCEILSLQSQESEKFICKYEMLETVEFLNQLKKYRKIFFYMPTWRSYSLDYLKKAAFNYEALNQALVKLDAVMVFKLHPLTPESVLSEVKGFSNILTINPKIDVYPILSMLHVLITDYSSIYFDFMNVKDAYTIFFPFDMDEYKNHDYSIAYDYDENINGIRVNTFDELLDSLKTESYKNIDIQKNKALYEKFWGKPEDKKDLILEIKTLVGLS